MEKFALLNLLKAIGGLSSPPNAETPAVQQPEPEQTEKNAELPNFMYETLLRHEAVSNRLHNKRH